MHFTSGTVIVRCAQTGKRKLLIDALGRADQIPICETDFADLLVTEHGQEYIQEYPVTFVSFSGVLYV